MNRININLTIIVDRARMRKKLSQVMRAQLQALEAAKEELAVKERQANLQRRTEVQRLEAMAQALKQELGELSKRQRNAVAALEARKEAGSIYYKGVFIVSE